jgi:ankyrin repeat protein
MLLAAGAKVNVATSQESSDNLRAGTTPLMAAGVNGNKILVQMLITKGADVNAKDQSGNTALIDAAHVGNADVVQLLIASHADVNASNTKGSTALSEAMRMKSSGLARCADLLRSAGAKG